jgi:hypothetical protein
MNETKKRPELSDKKYLMVKNAVMIVCIIFSCLVSCKKAKQSTNNCYPNELVARVVQLKNATIQKAPNGIFYIVEDNIVDDKLQPCNLPIEFQLDGLLVKISGNVKATLQIGTGPCCTNHFEITHIEIR